MELYDLINFIKKKKIELVSMGVFFGIFGLGAYFVFPTKYIAINHVFITRGVQLPAQVETSPTDPFAYEGYYAQQNAINYTINILGLLESDSTKGILLQKRNLPINSYNLRVLDTKMSFKKQSPQIIEVSFKSTDRDTAISYLDTLLQVILEQHAHLSDETDPHLRVISVADTPIVKTAYKNPFLNFGLGFVIGFVFTLLLLALQEYLINGQKSTSKKN